MKLSVDGLTLTTTSRGLRVSVAGRPFIAHWGVASGTLTHTEVDVDELTQTFALDRAAVTLRHTLTHRWTWRIAGVPSAAAPPPVAIELMPADDTAVWLWPGGNASILVVAPLDGAGPVLAWRLQRGWVERHDETFTVLPATPGRASAQWLGGIRPSWEALLADWGAGLPSRRAYREGEWVRVGGDDVAVAASPQVAVETDDDGTEVRGPSGVHRIQVHSASGTTVLELGWAPSAAGRAVERAGELLASGRLDGAAPWLLVAGALEAGALAAPDAAHDLLDANTAVLEGGGPLAVLAWCTEHRRTGEATALDAGLEELRACAHVPGAAEAGVVLAVALATEDRPTDEVAELLARQVRRPRPPHLWARLAWLEAHVVAGRAAAVRAELEGLAHLLGGGLPGEPLGVEDGTLVHVLRLWGLAGASPRGGETAEDAAAMLLATDPCDDVLAWLANESGARS